MTGRRAAGVALAVALALGACGRGREREHQEFVKQYLARVIEAYRNSDAELVDPLCGEEHGLRLLGLIGVKRDAGMFLDAQLLELRFVKVQPQGPDAALVDTRERWYYRDRKIGSGEQVGQDSTDEYQVRYVLRREKGKWVVAETEFLAEPVVQRQAPPVPVDPRILHGLPTPEEAGAGTSAAPPPAGAAQRGPPPGHPPVPARAAKEGP